MNTTALLVSIVGSVILVVLTLVFIAGFLFRCDLTRRRASKFSARRTRDPLALKGALVEFFARSKGSSRILRLLSAKRKPIGYQALVDEICFDEKWRRESDELPAGAIPAVLGIMQVAGLVRITRHGLLITQVGREVQRRIEPRPRIQKPKVRAIHSITGTGRHAATTLSSSDRTALRELPKKAHTLFDQ